MLLRFVLAVAISAGPSSPEAGTALLARSDTVRARAVATADGGAAVDALALAAAAAGRVFRPGGGVADIGYEERRTEAIRLAGQDSALMARIAALPDVERGAVRGAGPARQMLSGTIWRDRLVFRGGELAAIYVKADRSVRVSVRMGSRRLCDERRDSGRVLCQWHPAATGDAVVTIAGAPGTRFELFTN